MHVKITPDYIGLKLSGYRFCIAPPDRFSDGIHSSQRKLLQQD
ncbi:hypothetical protein [Neisseria yangbaofengii]|nr:hypothetical protein [Neisseria yangbaofengii]